MKTTQTNPKRLTIVFHREVSIHITGSSSQKMVQHQLIPTVWLGCTTLTEMQTQISTLVYLDPSSSAGQVRINNDKVANSVPFTLPCFICIKSVTIARQLMKQSKTTFKNFNAPICNHMQNCTFSSYSLSFNRSWIIIFKANYCLLLV